MNRSARLFLRTWPQAKPPSALLPASAKGQIPARQASRQGRLLMSTKNCPTIAMNAGEFEPPKHPDHHVLSL
jgi:hypothetical protein